MKLEKYAYVKSALAPSLLIGARYFKSAQNGCVAARLEQYETHLPLALIY
jgi:hypothetical protein